MDKIGNKIYELRKKQSLSQEQFAEKINVSRQIVSQWENNASTPKFDKIELICHTFNIDINYFLSETNTKESAVITANTEGVTIKTNNSSDEANLLKKGHTKAKKIFLIALMSISAMIFLSVISIIIYIKIATAEFGKGNIEVVSTSTAFISNDSFFWLVFIIELLSLFLFVYALKKYLKLSKQKDNTND